MRTTLDVDEDVLLAAKEMARGRGISLGRAVSELARRGFTTGVPAEVRNGIPLLPVSRAGALVSLEIVNALRDETP